MYLILRMNQCSFGCVCPTFLDELDVSLSPPVAIFNIAGVVAQVALLHRVDGQRDGNFLLPEVLPDRPAGGDRAQKTGYINAAFINSNVNDEGVLLS